MYYHVLVLLLYVFLCITMCCHVVLCTTTSYVLLCTIAYSYNNVILCIVMYLCYYVFQCITLYYYASPQYTNNRVPCRVMSNERIPSVYVYKGSAGCLPAPMLRKGKYTSVPSRVITLEQVDISTPFDLSTNRIRSMPTGAGERQCRVSRVGSWISIYWQSTGSTPCTGLEAASTTSTWPTYVRPTLCLLNNMETRRIALHQRGEAR